MSFKTIFARGWVKALIIALPLSVYYGTLAFIGMLIGFDDITRFYFAKDSYNKEPNWPFFLTSLAGLLGLAGLWLRFLFQERLLTRITYLNWIVTVLILIGIVDALFLIIALLWSGAVTWMFVSVNLPVICIAIYGVWLIKSILRPVQVGQ